MEFLGTNSEALERLVVEMYARRGLSTRDVEECFRDETTGELMISPGARSGRSPASCGRTTGSSPSGISVGGRARRVPVLGRRLRELEALGGQRGSLGSVGHNRRRTQGGVAAPGGGRQQGVRGLLDGVLEGHGGEGLEDPDLGDLRRGTGARERHRGDLPEERASGCVAGTTSWATSSAPS